jgi:hypothetical protein
MQKKIILVTQKNPDLDACMAIWLLKRFALPDKDCQVQFVPMGKKLKPEVESKSKVIYVDTSGGKYDHHDTNEYVCAASLVAKDFKLEKDQAIKRMLEYTLKVDHGLLYEIDVNDFDLINIIEGLNIINPKNPKIVVTLIEQCLDSIYISLKNQIEAENEFKKVHIFETKWGKSAAIITSNKRVRYIAHRKGFQVYIFVDPIKGYRGFTSPGDSDVNFCELFDKLRFIEPEADWFLHSSKGLLLCGSAKAPDRKLSSLTLEKMINLVKI